MPVKIKMCGMTRPEDAEKASKLGVDAIGIILSEMDMENIFDRYVEKYQAMKIIEAVPDEVRKIGVFVNEDPERINSLVEILDLDFVQLHGEEGPEDFKKIHCDIIKTVKVTGADSLNDLDRFKVKALLLDGKKGGSGESFDWEFLKEFQSKIPWFLAGGLNPDNITRAIQKYSPDWVDISSGIEGSVKGEKDADKMKRLIDAVRNT
tara:strand:+ start:579 stop:1199 length:621 start_codon:yes stop_codon:yes gene_type:complete